MENNFLIELVKGMYHPGPEHIFIKPWSVYFWEDHWESGNVMRLKGRELEFIVGKDAKIDGMTERICEILPPEYAFLICTNPEYNGLTMRMKLWNSNELEPVKGLKHNFTYNGEIIPKLIVQIRKFEMENSCMFDWNAYTMRRAYHFYREKGK